MSERRSAILSTTVRGITPVLLLLAVVVTFRGHNAPGGGFAGALLVGAALAVRALAEGPSGAGLQRVDPVVVVGAGLAIAVLSTVVPLLAGRTALDAVIWKLDVPAIGEVKVVTSMFFDLGVLVLVSGGVMAMLRALATPSGDPDEGGATP